MQILIQKYTYQLLNLFTYHLFTIVKEITFKNWKEKFKRSLFQNGM